MITTDIHDYANRNLITWDGDNSHFVINVLLPNLKLSDDDKHILAMAYGYNGEKKSYERDSDGETLVRDMFLRGIVKIKSPCGVVHDYLNRVPNHQTPDGRVWTRTEANALYRRIAKATGYGFMRRNWRWAGLQLTWYWWK